MASAEGIVMQEEMADTISNEICIAFWVAQVVGSLFGMFVLFYGGPNHLLSFMPKYDDMVVGFRLIMGPAFNLPGDILRIVIGVAHMAAGIGILVGLWIRFIVNDKLDEHMNMNFFNVMVLNALIGEFMIGVGICAFHLILDGNPGAGALFLPVTTLAIGTRLEFTPLESLDQSDGKFFISWCIICVYVLVVCFAMRCHGGMSVEELRNRKEYVFEETAKAQGLRNLMVTTSY